MDFVAGKPDPWGMKVNPAYKEHRRCRRAEWPLLDTYVPARPRAPASRTPAVYFTQIAAPVTTLRKIAEAVLDAWPERADPLRRATRHAARTSSAGSTARAYGTRFMLGIVSLGDAARLRPAHAPRCETTQGTLRRARPTASLARGGRAGRRRTERTQPFDARPGRRARAPTTPTPARWSSTPPPGLQNLPQADADKVAQFIRISTTEGQRPGSGNGELPEGYLPISKTGVTAPLWTRPRRSPPPSATRRAPRRPAEDDRRRHRRRAPAAAPAAGSAPGASPRSTAGDGPADAAPTEPGARPGASRQGRGETSGRAPTTGAELAGDAADRAEVSSPVAAGCCRCCWSSRSSAAIAADLRSVCVTLRRRRR